jgi:hypothetical protein
MLEVSDLEIRLVCDAVQTRYRTRYRLGFRNTHKEIAMSIGTLLLIILALILLGVFPAWPHSRGWGYGPSGLVGVIFVVLLVLFLMGRI